MTIFQLFLGEFVHLLVVGPVKNRYFYSISREKAAPQTG